MKSKFLPLALAIISILPIVSCQRRHSIEDRAKIQLPLSLATEIQDFEKGTEVLEIKDLKTVYVNDSICIMQFKPSLRDSTGRISEKELQYVYYVDMFLSRYYGRFIFRNEFRAVPSMTGKEIRENARKVRRDGENVYRAFEGHGNIITSNVND